MENPVAPTRSSDPGEEHDALTDPSRWVDLHGDLLYSFALLRTRDANVAQDLVQETFLAALKSRETFGGQSSERTWLVGILKHKLIDHFRKIKREIPLEDDGEETKNSFDQRGAWRMPPGRWPKKPERLLENQEFWQVFSACMDHLPPRLKQVFAMRELDDMKSEEICKVVGVTATNLWTMLHRARVSFGRCLENTWFQTAAGGDG